MITNQIEFIQRATKVLILKEGGEYLTFGTYQEIANKEIYFLKNLFKHQNKKEEQNLTEKKEINEKEEQNLDSLIIDDIMKDKKGVTEEKNISRESSNSSNNNSKESTTNIYSYLKYIQAGTGIFMLIFIALLIIGSQTIFHAIDIFLAYW